MKDNINKLLDTLAGILVKAIIGSVVLLIIAWGIVAISKLSHSPELLGPAIVICFVTYMLGDIIVRRVLK